MTPRFLTAELLCGMSHPPIIICCDIDMFYILFSTANDDFCSFIVQLQLVVTHPAVDVFKAVPDAWKYFGFRG